MKERIMWNNPRNKNNLVNPEIRNCFLEKPLSPSCCVIILWGWISPTHREGERKSESP